MDLLHQHWAIVAANPWLFITWTIAVASAVWAVIHFLYRHGIEEDSKEIERLRARLAELDGELANYKAASPATTDEDGFEYPEAGDHGLNILGPALTELVVGQTYSMTAKVPAGAVLKVHLSGSPPVYLEQKPGAWGYRISTRNWQANIYDQQDHTQGFTARSGEAELAFLPWRAGKIVMQVYEGARNPSWEKIFKAVDVP
jgi:hypothetical protein